MCQKINRREANLEYQLNWAIYDKVIFYLIFIQWKLLILKYFCSKRLEDFF
jgi:hypothetical protein